MQRLIRIADGGFFFECQWLQQATNMSEVEITRGVKKTVLKEAQPGAPSVQKNNKVNVHCTGYLKDGMKKFWR